MRISFLLLLAVVAVPVVAFHIPHNYQTPQHILDDIKAGRHKVHNPTRSVRDVLDEFTARAAAVLSAATAGADFDCKARLVDALLEQTREPLEDTGVTDAAFQRTTVEGWATAHCHTWEHDRREAKTDEL